MNSSNPLIQDLEKDIVNLILNKLELSNMSIEHAQLIAKFALSHLPENLTNEKLKQILPFLDDEFLELAGVVHKYLKIYEDEDKTLLTHDVQLLIKSGKLDEAGIKMRAYFNKKIIL